jgi:hypothetical protein
LIYNTEISDDELGTNEDLFDSSKSSETIVTETVNDIQEENPKTEGAGETIEQEASLDDDVFDNEDESESSGDEGDFGEQKVNETFGDADKDIFG